MNTNNRARELEVQRERQRTRDLLEQLQQVGEVHAFASARSQQTVAVYAPTILRQPLLWGTPQLLVLSQHSAFGIENQALVHEMEMLAKTLAHSIEPGVAMPIPHRCRVMTLSKLDKVILWCSPLYTILLQVVVVVVVTSMMSLCQFYSHWAEGTSVLDDR